MTVDRVEDGIQGKALAVVVDAPQLPLGREVGRVSRSRQVRRFARENQASHLLNVKDAEGETWLAGEAGVSFAAAIDGWAESAAGVADDVVLVPLDERIYAAELVDGLVENEVVFAERRLREKLDGWSGRTVRGFEGGLLGDALADIVALDAPPFDLRSRRYRRAAVALTVAGLYAPAQVAAVAVVAAIAAAAGLHGVWRDRAPTQTADEAREAALLALAMEGDFSGAAVLRGFARAAWDPAVILLHRDGLSEVAYEGGYDLRLSGRSPGGYPAAAARYAGAVGGHLEFAGAEWSVARTVGWDAAARRTVEEFGSRRLAERLHRAAETARAAVSAGPAAADGPAEERVYSLRIDEATPVEFAALAAGVEGRPYGIGRIRCAFEGHVAIGCEIALTAKGVAE